MKYHIIADSATVKGFSIFGVSGTVVELSHGSFSDVGRKLSCGVSLDACAPTFIAQAQEAFEKVLEMENLGVLILSAPVAELLRPQVDAHLGTGAFPQILVL